MRHNSHLLEALRYRDESTVLQLTNTHDFEQAYRQIQSYETTPDEDTYVEWDDGRGYERYDIDFTYSEQVRAEAIRFCAEKGRIDLLLQTGFSGYSGDSCPTIRALVLEELGNLARGGDKNAWRELLRLYDEAKKADHNQKARWDLESVARILVENGQLNLSDEPVKGKYLVKIIRDYYGRGENVRIHWEVWDCPPKETEIINEHHHDIVTYLCYPYTKRKAFLLGLE